MHWARIGIFEMKPNTIDAAIAKARNGLLPIFQQQPGFVSYQLVKLDGTKSLSYSVWETRAAADNAIRVASDWIKKNTANDIIQSQIHIGELGIDSAGMGMQPGAHP